MNSSSSSSSSSSSEKKGKASTYEQLRMKDKRTKILPFLFEYLIFDVANLVLQHLPPIIDHSKINPTFKSKFGSKGDGGKGKFNCPHQMCLAFDDSIKRELLFVCDFWNHLVQVFEKDGTFVRQYGIPNNYGTANNQFDTPSGIALDPVTQCIFVADSSNDRVQVLKLSDGNHVRTIGTSIADSDDEELNRPDGVAININQRLIYITEECNHRISVFTIEGQFVRKFGTKGSEPGQFNEPCGLAINQTTGDVYVADHYNNRIQVFSAAGNFIRVIGGEEGSDKGQFIYPTAVAVDADNNLLFVCDFGNSRVQIFSLDNGEYLAQLGTGTKGAADGQLNCTFGVAFDPSSLCVYVGDFWNHRIQVFSLE